MTVTGSQAAPAPGPHPAVTESHQTLRLLAVVDGSARTNRVVQFIVSLARCRASLDVVILNVQSKRQDMRLRGYQSFKQHEIDDRLVNEIGLPIVTSVSRRLTQEGIRNGTRIRIGEPVDAILQCAAEERCDAIVIADPPAGAFRRQLARMTGMAFGPLASLAVLAQTPVVFVK